MSRTCRLGSVDEAGGKCRVSSFDWGSAHVLHDTFGLFRGGDKLVFLLLDLTALRLGEAGGTGKPTLDGVQLEPGVVHILPGGSRKLELSVESRAPASEETTLHLSVLAQAGLADLFLSNSVLLETGSERILLGACVSLVKGLRGC